MLLYWLENIVIGVYMVLEMRAPRASTTMHRERGSPAATLR